MQPLDIAVCGCGPGGMAAALALNRVGHRVRIFEQFESPRPIGSGLMLQPTGLAVLEELGLAERMRGLGRRIDRLFGRVVPSNRIVLDVRYAALGSGDVRGLAVHRGALFNVLHDAVLAAGIPVVTRRAVTGIDYAASGRPILIMADGERFEPVDLVVDALGARSPIAQKVEPHTRRKPLPYGALWATVPWPGDGADSSFGAHDLEQRYEGASLMVGVLPVGRRHESGPNEATFFWSLKPRDYERWRADGLDAWKARARAVWPQTEPLLAHITDPDHLVLASYGHHTLKRPFAERLAIIGDAAHATSPQLGQGANMALLDALALARSLEVAPTIAAALAGYALRRRRHVALYQAMSAVFTPFYQSDSRVLPLLRDHLVQPMTRVPGVPRLLAAIVAGSIGGPLTGLTSPVPHGTHAQTQLPG